MITRKQSQKLWFCSITMLLLLAISLRFPFLSKSLEYDEIWSLEFFAPLPIAQILKDFSLPNNHPLNTIFLKFCFVKDHLWVGRLPAFLAGLGSVVLAGMLALRLAGRKAALITMLICAVSPQLIRYAYTSRGYGIQLFFILLFCHAACHINHPGWKWPIVLLISGILAVNSVSTALLFLFIPGLYCAWNCLQHGFQRKFRPWMAATVLFAGYCLWFVWSNWEALLGARQFGNVLTPGNYPLWLLKTTLSLCLWPGLLLFAVKTDRKNLLLLFFILFPLAISFFTNGGPPRIWLLALVISYIIAGRGIVLLSRIARRRQLLPKLLPGGLVLLLLTAIISSGDRIEWTSVEWRETFRELQQVPVDTFVVYGANDGYPILWNSDRAALNDFLNRILHPHLQSCGLLMINSGTSLDGQDNAYRVIKTPSGLVPLMVYGQHFEGAYYDLIPVNGKETNGEWLIAVIRPLPEYQFNPIVEQLVSAHPDLLKLNTWLTRVLNQNAKTFRYGLFAFQKNDHTPNLLQLVKDQRGAVSIYRLASPR